MNKKWFNVLCSLAIFLIASTIFGKISDKRIVMDAVSVFLLWGAFTTIFGNMAEKNWDAIQKSSFNRWFFQGTTQEEYVGQQKIAACLIIPFVIYLLFNTMQTNDAKRNPASDSSKGAVTLR